MAKKSSVDSSSVLFFADSVNHRQHCFVNDQSVQGNADKELIRTRKVRERLGFLYAQLEHQIHALPGTFHHAAQGKDLCNAAVAWLAIQYIIQCDTKRQTTGAFDYQPIPILAHKDAAAKLVVSMAYCVQNGLAQHVR